MSELVPIASAEILRAHDPTAATLRLAEREACHAEDHWIRTEAWRDRWLISFLNAGTRGAYRRAFASLWEVGLELGVAPLAMVRADVDRWVATLREFGNPAVAQPAPLGDTSLARYMATASSFYRYCLRWPCADPDCGRDCGAPWLKLNPVPDGDARPRARADSPQRRLEPEQVRAIVQAADVHSVRASALIALLTNCLRISEALGARIEDLGESKGHRTVRVLGKGRKHRTVPLPPSSWRRVEVAIVGRAGGPLIATASGRAMDRHAAWDLIQVLAVRAGVASGEPGEDPIGPHTFRHAAITHALKKKIPLADVQDWAGHADSRTTRRYDRREDDHDNSPAYAVAADFFG